MAICVGSCRGGFGNQHMKFYLFSKAGRARDVVMVGSSNLTGYGAQVQWNDMYTTIGQPALRELYTKVFEQLVRDRRIAEPYIHRTVGDYENEFFPMPSMDAGHDPVLQRLDAVRCATSGGLGTNGRTSIRVVMYGWVTAAASTSPSASPTWPGPAATSASSSAPPAAASYATSSRAASW